MSTADPADTAVSVYFEVRIDGPTSAPSPACDGLGVEVVVEQREEGGVNGFVHQLPGRIKYTNVKLTRPVNADTAKIAAWFRIDERHDQAHPGPDHDQEPRRQAGVHVDAHRRHPGALDGPVDVGGVTEDGDGDAGARPPRLPRERDRLMAASSTCSSPRRSSTCASPSPARRASRPAASIGVIKFKFNPKDYSMSLQSGWNFKPQKKSARTARVHRQPDALARRRGVPRRHRRGRRAASPAPSTQLFSTVRPTEKSISAGTPFPPIVVFSWGDAEPFVGVVKSVSATLTLFRPSGLPVRATCKVSMQEFDPSPAKQNPTSGALRSNRAHRVALGDSLASIANAEYGDPDAVAGDRRRQRARGPVQPPHRHASC